MGQYWLLNLPEVLRNAGLTVDLYPGWETRARSSGGYDDVRAVGVHHTASNTTPANDMAYCWKNADTRPIGALYLARDGRVTVGAAGATNTQGSGGPMGTSKGTIPVDAGNRYVLSIEAANAGTGEQWPKAQTDVYVKMVRALVDAYGLQVLPGDIHAHFEWTTRKADPAGNSPYASGSAKWDMNRFRLDVLNAGAPTPDPDPDPIPPQPPTLGDSIDMFIFIVTNGPENPVRETWTLCDGTQLAHCVNGNGAEVFVAAGIRQVKSSGAAQTEGLIKSCRTANGCPPEWLGTSWETLWEAQKL